MGRKKHSPEQLIGTLREAWEKGYNESSNGTICRELLGPEVFDTLLETQVLIERWGKHYNHARSHSSPGYRSPAPEADAPLEELAVKMDLAGDRSKVKYCRHNKHSTWIYMGSRHTCPCL